MGRAPALRPHRVRHLPQGVQKATPATPRRFRTSRSPTGMCVGASPCPSTWCSPGSSPAPRWRPPTSKWVSAPAPRARGPARFAREHGAPERPRGGQAGLLGAGSAQGTWSPSRATESVPRSHWRQRHPVGGAGAGTVTPPGEGSGERAGQGGSSDRRHLSRVQ